MEPKSYVNYQDQVMERSEKAAPLARPITSRAAAGDFQPPKYSKFFLFGTVLLILIYLILRFSM